MKFAIYGQTAKPIVQNIVRRLFNLFNQYGGDTEVIFEEEFYSLLKEENILLEEYKTFGTENPLTSEVDFFISVGGDGTMLRAANFIKNTNIPIVGINAGRLGFLANVQHDNLE